MIYASVCFAILYKDSQKLEKTRKYRKPMPVSQRVIVSIPPGTDRDTERSYQKALSVSRLSVYGIMGINPHRSIIHTPL